MIPEETLTALAALQKDSFCGGFTKGFLLWRPYRGNPFCGGLTKGFLLWRPYKRIPFVAALRIPFMAALVFCFSLFFRCVFLGSLVFHCFPGFPLVPPPKKYSRRYKGIPSVAALLENTTIRKHDHKKRVKQ
jgi:hypothetical protein